MIELTNKVFVFYLIIAIYFGGIVAIFLKTYQNALKHMDQRLKDMAQTHPVHFFFALCVVAIKSGLSWPLLLIK